MSNLAIFALILIIIIFGGFLILFCLEVNKSKDGPRPRFWTPEEFLKQYPRNEIN